MRSRSWLPLLSPLLFAACPTRTIYYDGGAGGAGGQAGAAGAIGAGMAGAAGELAGGAGNGGAGAGGAPLVGGAAGQGRDVACDATSIAVTEASVGLPGGGGDQFGKAVAVRNGVMLVTAPNAAGGLGRVYSFSGSGSSYLYLQFIAPNGASPSSYAQAVALDRVGSTAAVAGAVSGADADWTFTRTGANWFLSSSFAGPDTSTGIAIDSGTFVAGGLFAAYVYAISGGAAQTLLPSDFTPSSTAGFFSGPLAISGNTILVTGEPLDSSGELGHFGYVFVKGASGWAQQAKLVPTDLLSNTNPHFQFSVALDGTTAVLATSAGAYVFSQNGTSWTQVQKIPSPTDTNGFGSAVDLSGNALVISAASANGAAGFAYLYGRSNGQWTLGPRLSTGASDGFGAAVAVSGTTVAVGAPSSGSDGAVFLFSCAFP